MPNKNYVTPEEVENARRVGILEYFERYYPGQLKKDGSDNLCWTKHDSFKITKSTGLWCWHSRTGANGKKIGGNNAIDFLMYAEGFSFQDAVRTLNDMFSSHILPAKVKPRPEPRRLELPKKNLTCSIVKDYLILKRGIAPAIVNLCLVNDSIFESEKYHSCVFVGRDDNNVPRYASIRGTSSSFRGEASGSDKRYGFTIHGRKDSDVLMAFESPIDAMSEASLRLMMGDDVFNATRISQGGLSLKAVEHYLKQHAGIQYVLLCYDNDQPGKEAASSNRAYLEKKFSQLKEVSCSLPPEGMDYNGYLMAVTQRKMIRGRYDPETLAERLDSFHYAFDQYGYLDAMDAIETREDMVEKMEQQLANAVDVHALILDMAENVCLLSNDGDKDLTATAMGLLNELQYHFSALRTKTHNIHREK